MSPQTLRTIVAVFLFIHAIGHIQGVFAALGLLSTDNWNTRSWILDDLLGENASRTLALVIWALCVLGFLATAFAFLGLGLAHEWWRTLAVVFAVPSLLGLIFYWNSFAMFFNKAGLVGVNTWIIFGALLLNYPSEAELGF